MIGTELCSTPEPVAPMIAEPARGRQEIVHFPCGLAGFESCRSFVLFSAEAASFQWLSSVEGPPASFLVVDPRRVVPTFRYALTRADLDRLGATTNADLLWLVIVLIEADGAITANLRAPIVIHPGTMIGQQVIPQASTYPLRHIIVPAAGA